MEAPAEWLEEMQGLRLVRSFLVLPVEKRRLVLQFVEALANEPSTPGRQEWESSAP
ncbi:MAG: hypothetical protein HY852_03920 [Bradyrhizobium sp.]|uniref:hypothetical protein n=1 Tax=Bradyrhizobium sp. TaxID=376 RepID=UPI0025BAC88A|nr:hypothetical protein [Bradyrhizobium sp.]MBI5260950.1 hypothetical protein [Bradyrhizobium sp.]